MRIGPILHQQIFQLKWHFLACVALVMVLPLEEALVSLRAGEGFYSFSGAGGMLLLTPLLGALLACANVQADMDEKRYLFWRSKPAGVWPIMSLKYIVGLLMALAVLACPLLFSIISTSLCGRGELNSDFYSYARVIAQIAWLAYSVSFFTNVLVRRTARAWLIGMALTCFVLLIPIVLPLGIRDIVSDVAFNRASAAYLSILLGVTVGAFVLAVLAVKYDWHLRTSLKGLLWSGAGLIFGLTLLFSGQVANIRILDEKAIELPLAAGPAYSRGLVRLGDTVVLPTREGLQHRYEVTVNQRRIVLKEVQETSSAASSQDPNIPPLDSAIEQGLSPGRVRAGIYRSIGTELYYVVACSYYVKEQITDKYGDIKERRRWRKLFFRSFRIIAGIPVPQSCLDLSECIVDEQYPYTDMRLIGNDVIVARTFSRHCLALGISEQGDLSLTERGTLKAYSQDFADRKQDFTLPLFPLKSLALRDRIRLSIDLIRSFRLFLPTSTLVQIHNDPIQFTLVSQNDVARYDVMKWDEENIHCQFRDARPFTLLERRSNMFRYSPYFVENGKLYLLGHQSLMVFDIVAEQGIRKLGQFERISMTFSIEDIELMDNGDILMLTYDPSSKEELDSSTEDTEELEDGNNVILAQDPNQEDDSDTPYHLYLLENPR